MERRGGWDQRVGYVVEMVDGGRYLAIVERPICFPYDIGLEPKSQASKMSKLFVALSIYT